MSPDGYQPTLGGEAAYWKLLPVKRGRTAAESQAPRNGVDAPEMSFAAMTASNSPPPLRSSSKAATGWTASARRVTTFPTTTPRGVGTVPARSEIATKRLPLVEPTFRARIRFAEATYAPSAPLPLASIELLQMAPIVPSPAATSAPQPSMYVPE